MRPGAECGDEAKGVDPRGTLIPPTVALAIGDDAGGATASEFRLELYTPR